MKPPRPTIYFTLVILLAVSFWSSGVLLIRFLDSLHIWSAPTLLLWLVYVLSVPLIYISIRGVQKCILRVCEPQSTLVVFHITGLVLIIHAIALTLMPHLYDFNPEPGLYATAWLLWFGGIAIMLETRHR